MLKTLQLQIGSTDDLKCLFVLLLRCYNPSLQSKQYLQDLIVTNHSLLLLLDGIRDIPGANVTDMLSHIRQYVGLMGPGRGVLGDGFLIRLVLISGLQRLRLCTSTD